MRSRGGVRFSLTVSDIRTDYIYHSLSALVQTLRYFRDASDWAPPPTDRRGAPPAAPPTATP